MNVKGYFAIKVYVNLLSHIPLLYTCVSSLVHVAIIYMSEAIHCQIHCISAAGMARCLQWSGAVELYRSMIDWGTPQLFTCNPQSDYLEKRTWQTSGPGCCVYRAENMSLGTCNRFLCHCMWTAAYSTVCGARSRDFHTRNCGTPVKSGGDFSHNLMTWATR